MAPELPKRSPRSAQPGVGLVTHSEEGFGHLLVLGARGAQAEPRDGSRGVGGHEQAQALVPPQTVGPTDVGVTGRPSFASALDIPLGHGRTIQSFKARVRPLFSSGVQEEGRQVQRQGLDEIEVRAYQPVELRAMG